MIPSRRRCASRPPFARSPASSSTTSATRNRNRPRRKQRRDDRSHGRRNLPDFRRAAGKGGQARRDLLGIVLRTGPRNAVLHHDTTPSWRPRTASGPARSLAWTTRPTPSIPECHSNAARPAPHASTPHTRPTGTTTWTDTTFRDPRRSTGSGTAGQTTSASTTAPRMTESRKARRTSASRNGQTTPSSAGECLSTSTGTAPARAIPSTMQAENPSSST